MINDLKRSVTRAGALQYLCKCSGIKSKLSFWVMLSKRFADMYQSQYIYMFCSQKHFFFASPIFNTCPQIQKLRFILITFYFEKISYTVKLYSCFFKKFSFLFIIFTHPFFLIPKVLLPLIDISFHLLRYITQFKWLIRIREAFDIANELMTFKIDSFVTRKKNSLIVFYNNKNWSR